MFTSKSIFALVVVIFASTHLCLNRSPSAEDDPFLSVGGGGKGDPNGSILAPSTLQQHQQQTLHHQTEPQRLSPGAEQQQQSDHNFYSPNSAENRFNLSSAEAEAKATPPQSSQTLTRRKRALKRSSPPVCLSLQHRFLSAYTYSAKISPNSQCSVKRRRRKTPSKVQSSSSSLTAAASSVATPSTTTTPTSKVPNYNATAEVAVEGCDLPEKGMQYKFKSSFQLILFLKFQIKQPKTYLVKMKWKRGLLLQARPPPRPLQRRQRRRRPQQRPQLTTTTTTATRALNSQSRVKVKVAVERRWTTSFA